MIVNISIDDENKITKQQAIGFEGSFEIDVPDEDVGRLLGGVYGVSKIKLNYDDIKRPLKDKAEAYHDSV